MKSRKVSLLYAVLLACAMGLNAASAQVGGDFDRAAAAHRQGDYLTSVKLWQPLAGKGQVDAQYNLGVMYYSGDGVKQDYAEAAKWFRMAAEQGDKQAQYYLGSMYLNGEGVKQSESEAQKWYTMNRRAHRHNHAQMEKWQAQLAEMRKQEELRLAYEDSRLHADEKIAELKARAGLPATGVKLAGLPTK
ncbi:MAG: hypothetical protein AUK53_05240 [Betaproteobacteria bacterium CG2_30_59_46]|nr:MAG: hypothetical protein AUK53_05240 [Betaproteobacteria bacterium CG2_30_59_46]PIQ14239.1 MAG: hypothetical protein COW70_00395 [Hydrogenophilales bacterium CG18_big_fil_WC_8_21_14_2_50_58_12]PIY01012.1 MAG: sel1 repeat family protein [Hydrogenophilales bacterium CG_4_10_14_3_um_filter_58_23]PJB08931.1 MAG: sel1 repeat family protein [Hydrogenophilales bacterium CG_4_9_14_3_um_filter_59_35]